MHLAIDVREACVSKPTGKGVWVQGFLQELLLRDIDLTLLSDHPVPSPLLGSKNPKQVHARLGLRWHVSMAGWLRRSRHIDAYISPTSYIIPSLLGKNARCIPIIHDLIAFQSEPHDRKATMIERLTLKRAVMNAPLVCTVSHATRANLLHKYPSLDASKVVPIFAGPLNESVMPNQPDGKTILCIGTLSPRKNQLRLIQAYRLLPDNLRSQYHLILAGNRGWNDGEIVQLARATPGAEWKEYVESSEYERLMNTATVFALPSLYEGFGMQILDAMQRGLPILTSNRGSLNEVTAGAALVTDPENVESIAKGLQKLLTDPELRSELRRKAPAQARQYSWRRTVDLFVNALSQEL